MSYYENQNPGQWPAPNNPPQQPAQAAAWDHQTPPARSGASSAIPRDDNAAFVHQLEEVDRAIDNLMKSGKMFNMGGRRKSLSPSPARFSPGYVGRPPPGGPRPHSMAEFGSDPRHNPQTNLQNYYASQRHQSSRGSNEAESMIQAKRRMAAARERDLRNYHQEQQYNRTVLSDTTSNPGRAGRTLSPGGMSEDERHELIARQRSALYGEGQFPETGGHEDETGGSRPGLPPVSGPVAPGTAAGMRGPSPLAYDFVRSSHADGAPVPNNDSSQPSRVDSNASPAHSNAPSSKGRFENSQTAQQSNRTSNSSPGGSLGEGAPIATKPTQLPAAVAPIGTRPGVASAAAAQAAGNNRSTPPTMSPLARAPVAGEEGSPAASSGPSNPPSASADGPVGLGGWGGRGGWGNKSGLQTSTSVWG